MRQDLLALTPDDLATLANRGILKRAQKEAESLTFECDETPEGGLTFRWSDGPTCVLPAGKTLAESQCDCGATTLCRHLVRSVLVYQQVAAQAAATAAEARPPQGPWDPGAITDEALAAHYKKAALTRLRGMLAEGHLVELVRSAKPTARFHTLSVVLRFLVPGDIRYTHCDCGEPAPCSHVPLAVWAFRLLEPGQVSGLISTQHTAWPVPAGLLGDIEAGLCDLAEAGLAGATEGLAGRLHRLEARCRDESLIWPAEALADLSLEYERYAGHDARFTPARVAELIGEVVIRCDAIRNGTDAVPQLFVRGTERDRETQVGTARLVGLGCAAQVYRGGVTLASYLQDLDSGAVVAVSRDFEDPAPPASGQAVDPPPFWQLANRVAFQGLSLAGLGARQLLIKGGKRSASFQFIPGRAKSTSNPQAFAWESLRAPALAEDWAEVRGRLAAQPPTCLRPRRVAENLFICPVQAVEHAHFATAEQQVQAILRDQAGEPAVLIHPYVSRAQEGTEALLKILQRGEGIRFVAGQVRLSGSGLVVMPVAVIWQEGETRSMLQPWIEHSADGGGAGASSPPGAPPTAHPPDPTRFYPGRVLEALGDLYVMGLQRATVQTARSWQELVRLGLALGFVRFVEPVKRVADCLAEKAHVVEWDWRPAAQASLEISALARLALEEIV